MVMETKPKKSAEQFIKDIRRRTRRIFTSEQKILIVMEALRGEHSVAEICRKHGIHSNVFYKWNKEFMEAGKKRLAGDTQRDATSGEVEALRKENQQLKELVADLALRYEIVKKACLNWINRQTQKVYAVISTGETGNHLPGRPIRTTGKKSAGGVGYSQEQLL
jgi:transposase